MSGSKGPEFYDEMDIEKIHMLAACAEGNIDQVREFIDRGVQVDGYDDDGVTALQLAAARGHTKLMEYLLTLDPNLEGCNVVGYTALLHACREGHIEIAKLLIQRGARLDVTTFMGATSLTLACAGGHLELVQYLMTFKDAVDLNPKTPLVTPSPLMAAAFKNQPVISSCLVSRGARTDYVMPQLELDIISCVVMCSSSTMFSTLLDLGARIEGIRNYRNSSIDKLVDICQRHDIWRILTDHKRQCKRTTPKSADIREVIFQGRIMELTDLLRPTPHSIEKWKKLECGETPLMYAVIFGQIDAVRVIIDSRANLNGAESEMGLTALMIAAILGDNDMIITLLHADAKTCIKCQFGWTAIEFAYCATGVNPKVISMMHRRQANLPLTSRKTVELTSLAPSLNRSGRYTFSKVLQRIGLTETEHLPSSTPREELISGFEVANIDFATFSERFIMADDILNGNKRRKQFRPLSFDDYMRMVRNVAASWNRNGFLLKPFPLGIPFNGDYGKIFYNMTVSKSGGERACDGNYSEAQKNCAIMIGQAPSTKTSSNSLSSIYSDTSCLRKSAASSHLQRHVRPTALSSSASGVKTRYSYDTPPSPSAHSLQEACEKRNPAKIQLPLTHLRSASQSGHPSSYQYLNESTSSPRISPKRKVSKCALNLSFEFVQHKLKSIGLSHYAQVFREQEVDAATFLKLNESDIREIVNTVSSNESDIAAIVDLVAELRQHYSSKLTLDANK